MKFIARDLFLKNISGLLWDSCWVFMSITVGVFRLALVKVKNNLCEIKISHVLLPLSMKKF